MIFKPSLMVVIVAALLLGACNNAPKWPARQAAKIACPQIFILKDTDRVARFLPDGEKPSIKNLVFEARSTFGSGECNYDNVRRLLTLTFPIGAIVKKAPLFAEESSEPVREELEFFIGVRDKQGTIIKKQAVAMSIESSREEDDSPEGTPLLRAFFADKSKYDDLIDKSLIYAKTKVSVNIFTENEYNAQDYKIYIGFLITESELQYNRSGYLPSF